MNAFGRLGDVGFATEETARSVKMADVLEMFLMYRIMHFH